MKLIYLKKSCNIFLPKILASGDEPIFQNWDEFENMPKFKYRN